MTNTFKKGGRNLTANILIIKQYVIISMFPVHTGINRTANPATKYYYNVPCMHRDKPIDCETELFLIVCSLYAQG